jgi:KDPG and KHG aldolase
MEAGSRDERRIRSLAASRIVPVPTAADADEAERACEALLAGGLTSVEITFRTDAAADAIRLIYGLLQENDVRTALAYGVAHGALAMTTPGDTSMATLDEVERVMKGGGARIAR